MESTTTLAKFREILTPYLNANERKATKMMFYRNRLKSFSSWPFSSSDKCTPENMATAGFYSISKLRNDTSVKCFCCLKELDGWESMDDPWEEHKRHQKDCPYIKLNTVEQQWTLEEWIDLQQAMAVKLLEIRLKSDLENLESQLDMKQNQLQKERRKRRK
ncbi:hypothetical protein M8J76_010573 [Diaphorina citri]|nr:hypothetical protein M8J76_010573 [Diaphorina citri]